jgi:hypothetical protein
MMNIEDAATTNNLVPVLYIYNNPIPFQGSPGIHLKYVLLSQYLLLNNSKMQL